MTLAHLLIAYLAIGLMFAALFVAAWYLGLSVSYVRPSVYDWAVTLVGATKLVVFWLPIGLKSICKQK